MKQNTNENAANRNSFVGNIFSIGEKKRKEEVLNSLPEEWAKLHRDGHIHIHELDSYSLTYNCLTFNTEFFPYKDFEGETETRKVIHLFAYLKQLFTEMGNEQSGGMAFANFDNEMADIITELGIKTSNSILNLIYEELQEFIRWCTDNHTREGLTSYYITLNLGLARNELARKICSFVIKAFEEAGSKVYKPNIVFKVKKGINSEKIDPNYDLYMQALGCTAKKMIPTYLFCDCEEDRNYDPYLLDIMGCRTRVVDDIYGKTGSIGRGNIANISINLPRLALETCEECNDQGDLAFFTFYEKWEKVASVVKDILINRYNALLKLTKEDFPTLCRNNLWCEEFSSAESLEDVFKHGTLSIGFIGLSEAMELIYGTKMHLDPEAHVQGLVFVQMMRKYCDELTRETGLNFSLLGTAGEMISGRFVELDKKLFKPAVDIFKKGFYTNSFHVEVDAGIPKLAKLLYEGSFHKFCNGGSISYLELGEAPIGNVEGLDDLVKYATNVGVHYLGFNFPKDICNDCKNEGIFDVCPECGSSNITRLRRVSGYIEVLDGFTPGKKNEVKRRKTNR